MRGVMQRPDRPRVYIVAPRSRPLPPVLDGAPQWVIEHTVNRMRQFDPRVVSPWSPTLKNSDYDRAIYRHVRPNRFSNLFALTPYTWRKRQFGTTHRPAITYACGVQKLLHRLGPDIVVAHSDWSLTVSIRRTLPRTKLLFYAHDNHLKRLSTDRWAMLMDAIDGLIAVAPTPLAEAIEAHGAISVPCRAIVNGVESRNYAMPSRERFGMRKRLGLSSGPVVIYCGRLRERKGVDVLLQAFAAVHSALPSSQLLVIGSTNHMDATVSEFERDCHEFASSIGPSAVVFTGYVPYEEVPNFLMVGDIGVLPSIDEEGLPLGILEYAAAGMPVIASKVGGVADVIRHGKEGLLVDRSALREGLAASLRTMLEAADLRRRLGQAARKRASEFTWERTSTEFEEFVSYITDEEASPHSPESSGR